MDAAKDYDRCSVPGVTIDGANACELDDAIWIETQNGKTVIWVSIADVASIVPIASSEARDAFELGFTRYNSQGAYKTMLPSWVTHGKLGMLPEDESPVMYIRMELDSSLEVQNYSVGRGLLRSQKRYTFETVGDQILNGVGPDSNLLRQWKDMCLALLEKRRNTGALAVYDIYKGWTVTEDGKLMKLNQDECSIGYVIVQECMILANYYLARWAVENNLPFLYRNHKSRICAPDITKMAEDIHRAFLIGDVQELDLLRSRMHLVVDRAFYSPEVEGHYAMNLPVYSHCTSPKRRFADLANQYQIEAFLDGEHPILGKRDLARIGKHLLEITIEDKDAKSSYFRQQAHLDALRNIENSGLDQIKLNSSTFKKVLESLEEKDLEGSRKLRSDIAKKVRIEPLNPTIIFSLLMLAEKNPEPWKEVGQALAEVMAVKTGYANSVFTYAHQNYQWSMVKIKWHPKQELGYDLSARVTRAGVEYEVRTPKPILIKQDAARYITNALLSKVFSLEMNLDHLIHKGGGVIQLDSVLTVVKPGETGVKVSELQTVCQKRGWKPPKKMFEEVQAKPIKVFSCVAWITDGEEKLFESKPHYASKKKAA